MAFCCLGVVGNGSIKDGIWEDILGWNLNFIRMHDFGTFGLKIRLDSQNLCPHKVTSPNVPSQIREQKKPHLTGNYFPSTVKR
jgi:hypothetical protein